MRSGEPIVPGVERTGPVFGYDGKGGGYLSRMQWRAFGKFLERALNID